MIGSVTISVRDRRNSYRFTLKRNITILSGDSGRGKTTLYEMIAEFNRFGKDSGVKIDCTPGKKVIALGGGDWQEQLGRSEDSIIVIDEDNHFIRSKDFAEAVQHSDSYFLLITRSNLEQLPYSVDEIYEISGQKRKSLKTRYKGIDL